MWRVSSTSGLTSKSRVKSLKNQGIILALASKNDETIAIEAINNHPEMILSMEDFVAHRINWEDKAKNLIEITKIISKTSNVYYKFTIIDGWQEFQFNKYSKETFGEKIKLDYHEIIADTYNYILTDSLKKIVNRIENFF